MAKIEVKITFDQLKVIRESDEKSQNRRDGSGSEPYFWVTYFKISGDKLFTEKPVDTYTPVFNQLRREFRDNVKAGDSLVVPAILKVWNGQVETSPYCMVGVIVLLMEQDRTPEDAIHSGLLSFASSVDELLNNLVKARVRDRNLDNITQEEIQSLKKGIKSRVKKAIRRKLSLGELILNQDDNLGITYQIWTGDELEDNPTLSLPRMYDEDEEAQSKNVFELTGMVSVRRSRPDLPN